MVSILPPARVVDIVEERGPHETESLCPVCLERVKATRLVRGDEVFFVKQCDEHGRFSTVIWRGEPSMEQWRRPKAPAHVALFYGTAAKGCPFDCGLCSAHEQIPCSVLIEVTDRCNLSCAVCFADTRGTKLEDPSSEDISLRLERAMAAVGPSNLQLSGGEPTLRDDLPEIIEIARRIGYTFIQVNTNGLRLASDRDYARRLEAAGLSSVFLQFDGVDDEVYLSLRGRALLEEKLRAIEACGEAGIGVVLVPTLVKGVNTDSVGAIVRQALRLVPAVRGIHFQPVSYFGRFPKSNGDKGRFTLPELMRSLEEQTEGLVKVRDFSPPGCEHAHCSFHATYIRGTDGRLRAIGAADEHGCCSRDTGAGGVKKTVETVSRRWRFPGESRSVQSEPFLIMVSRCCGTDQAEASAEEPLDLDVFLQDVSLRSFTISAMAFQDVENLDLERLKGCCISVVAPDGRLIPFCIYNLTSRDGMTLYRNKRGQETS